MTDLFSNNRPSKEEIYPQLFVLANYVDTSPLLDLVKSISARAPFRTMMTPMGYPTGVAFTNCGELGWISDQRGYRYAKFDPSTNSPWPELPQKFKNIASKAANKVGWPDFEADACLINQYKIGSQLGSHQDKNESDFSWPIVTISIGLPAVFQIFGNQRGGNPLNYKVYDGDVLVWGGSARLVYHGVRKVTKDPLAEKIKTRVSLTFRKAG